MNTTLARTFGPYQVHQQWRIMIRHDGEKVGKYRYFSSKNKATRFKTSIDKQLNHERTITEKLEALRTRKCTSCHQTKTLPNFYRNRKRWFDTKCKKCRLSYATKLRRIENKERYNNYRKRWREKNPDKTKAYYYAYATKNRDKIRRTAKLRRLRDPIGFWVKYIRATFGITADQYNDMLKKQKNVCAICKSKENKRHQNGKIKRLSVDHNHNTGVVRGLLCDNCNSLLGRANDDYRRLIRAAKYLREHFNIKPLRRTPRETP